MPGVVTTGGAVFLTAAVDGGVAGRLAEGLVTSPLFELLVETGPAAGTVLWFEASGATVVADGLGCMVRLTVGA